MIRTLKSLATLAVAGTVLFSTGSTPSAQLRVQPVLGQQGTVALQLVLRKLHSTGTLMMATAHPDDENNALLAMTGIGKGWRTALVSATRGDGGQNEIGPELSDALAVLRTEELLAAHRFDGAEQYFTRAVDFGFSFSIDETLQKWGKDEILADEVRMIRMLRPDVLVGFLWGGPGGGQHHQASAQLAAEAFRAAADPSRYPEQLKEGLRPWQAKKFYYTLSFGRQNPVPEGIKALEVTGAEYDPLLGRSYAEISAEARSMHKCQGMSQLLALPGSAMPVRYVLQDTTLPDGTGRAETSVIDGIDATWSGLAAYAQPAAPQALTDALSAIASDITAATEAAGAKGPASAAAPIASGLKRVRELRAALPGMGLSEDAVYEIDFRLAQKQQQFNEALVLAHGIEIDVLAEDGLVIPGQKLSLVLRATGRTTEGAALKTATFQGFGGGLGCGGSPLRDGRPFECKVEGQIPAVATLTTNYFHRVPDAARYRLDPGVPFGAPFAPTPFRVGVRLGLSGEEVPVLVPVQYRYEGNIFSGEKRMELQVVPSIAVRITPAIAIVPSGAPVPRARTAGDAGGRELRVSVINQTKGAADGEARLEVPTGWTVTPATAPVRFTREDEEVTVRFHVAPATRQPGSYPIKAVVRLSGAEYSQGYQVVEYPHTQRRHLVDVAQTELKVLDVKIAPNLTVGYVMGVGDQVPPAIEQLGARVELLTSDDLAWGNLSKYDVIVTGVRAYERRQDLRAHNNRLLEYVERGGTVLVQYNKFEFNQAQYGPWPGKVSSDRVTDENASIGVLVPTHPAFASPNRIDASAWEGWVQERGLYFLGERDPRYTDLLETTDTFEYNAGAKRGALVEARVGKGRWIYIGLNLWRQLPAGTPGAYRLMANLLSLGKAPAQNVSER